MGAEGPNVLNFTKICASPCEMQISITSFQYYRLLFHRYKPENWLNACIQTTMSCVKIINLMFNPLNPELNPICYLLALLGAHHFLHVSRIRVKPLTLRRLMSYIYGAPILDVSRSHTTTQHSR